ncbi:hypothetical protein [Rhodovulum marinum]|uniref:Uncharacterized protein n=1 Tax=Rhodovulum marinum TaxID=320662 RepID=A0A4R2PSM1_9RHOB|nr:hypothetical protein [Rhodovulum marinum]TCP38797.1 hypothetical protein EV662_11731 [Rhodovulum marinum]
MADTVLTTPAPGNEGADVLAAHTAISRRFTELLALTEAAVSAERDLDGVEPWDPAVAHWPEAAERAWQAAGAAAEAVLAMHLARDEDRPLQQMALMFQLALGLEAPRAGAQLIEQVQMQLPVFKCPGANPVAGMVNRTLGRAAHVLAAVHAVLEPDATGDGPGDLPPAGAVMAA